MVGIRSFPVGFRPKFQVLHMAPENNLLEKEIPMYWKPSFLVAMVVSVQGGQSS